MDISVLMYLAAFLMLFILSAFFSASETAFFSHSHADINRLRKRQDASSKQIVILFKEPKKLLISIVIGNTLVNIAAASLAAILTLQLSDYFQFNETIALVLNVVIITMVLLIFSEIVPKVAAVRNPFKIAAKFVFPLTFFYYLFSPIASILYLLTQWLTHILKLQKNKNLLTEEELRTLVDFGEEKGTLQKDEKEMIHSIFEFGETTVKEIMVPRIDMICASTTDSLESLLKIIREHLHSRIPVYKERVDNIIGVIYAKDLLPFVNSKKPEHFNMETLTRPAYFVPEQKKIDELLREFQNEKIHMAIVVDEYGGTSGLVTLEDIIEEIVGEIQDEYDTELPLYKQIDKNTYIIDGSMPLEALNEELGFNLPTETGVETLGGFLYGLFGSVPQEKDTAVFKQYNFTVQKVYHRRIKQIKVTWTPESNENIQAELPSI